MSLVASQITSSGLATTLTVAAGLSICVNQVLIANNSGSTTVVSFQTTEAAPVTFTTVVVPNGETFRVETTFIAAKGLAISAAAPNASVYATVFHGSAGA